MIDIKNKADCCGCNACGDICPVNAISFISDIEGFWYPKVDLEKCIDCGLCEKTCPIINIQSLKHNDLDESVYYAAENKNIEIVFDSTSGGLYSALADAMLDKGGYIGGAVFNDDFSVKHILSKDRLDLPRLRSSKYLQSNAIDLYRNIKSLLKDNQQVLVCGTPCQMAALRAFLGKSYPNLIIVDFICRGVNSPKVWRKYLDSFEERYNSPVIYAKAKSKEYGWRNLTQKVALADGQIHYETKDTSEFMKGFLRLNLYCRPSCYECVFKDFPRISDITLADYWGIEHLNTTLDKNIGLSLVMLNSEKGKKFFETIKDKINYVQTDKLLAIKGNPALIRPLPKPLINRERFYEDLNTHSFEYISRHYITTKSRKSIKSLIRRFLKYALIFCKTTRLHYTAVFKTLRYSLLFNIMKGKVLLFTPYCSVVISKSAKLHISAVIVVGKKIHFPYSKLETRLLLLQNSELKIDGAFSFGYGSDIEVFEHAKLIIGGKKFTSSYTNINCTIICGEKIEIGYDVVIGRNVTIRDTNGGHYINRPNYKNTKPVKIGNKVWIASDCTIMPGVTIGDGAVIGAHTLVLHDVPPYTLVAGNPQKIIQHNVLWK